jgi:hypothetical protein
LTLSDSDRHRHQGFCAARRKIVQLALGATTGEYATRLIAKAVGHNPDRGSIFMKEHLAFLLCSATGLLAWNAACAAPAPSAAPVAPASYAELLEPIPNAREALIADDLARAQQPRPLIQLVQYYHHHHHHHHHRYFRHHHHHHGFFGGGIFIAPPVYAPSCYYQRRVYITPYGERVWRRVRVCD